MAVDSRQRTRVTVLAGLGVVLVTVVAWQYASGVSTRAGAAGALGHSARPAAPARPRGATPASVDPAALEIRLAQLDAVAPEPAEASRDPFRFRPAAPPPPPTPAGQPGSGGAPTTGAPPVGAPVEPSGPPVAPPPPPISFKFIGVLSQAAAGRIAVLSDGKFVYHGREGDIIEGRYRVVKIGEESIQLEYVDGRGRQTIRLSGS